jgi:hypothetical protein
MRHDCPFQAGIFLHVTSGNSFFPRIDPLFWISLFPFWIKRQFYYIQDSYLRESDEAPVTFFHVR